MFIRTSRMFLRPCWPEDRHEMLALISGGAITPGAVGLPSPFTAEDVQRFIDRPSEPSLPHFFITLPKINGGELIGGIGLGCDGDEIGLGYWITRAHHGRGYAAEAIRAVLNFARTLGHRRVIASHIPGARSSARVLEKVGFVTTSELHSRLEASSLAKTYVIELSASIDLEDNDALGQKRVSCANL
ncbi:MAG TPA: GNAT family N-acetyltransferase [Novosphingobium sp.]